MHLSTGFLTTALAVASVAAKRGGSRGGVKTSFHGDFTIDRYQLYPENADYDPNTGKLYIGQLWNASLGIYDITTKQHEVVEFPGISHNPMLNMGGVGVDKRTGLVSLVANGPLEFPTNGANVAGDRWLISYDPVAKQEVYRVNLTVTSQGKYGGFQDVEQDPVGNTFVVGSFPGTITKVSADGATVTPWFLPPIINTTTKGLTGIAAANWTLLAYGDASGGLWKLDMRFEKGVPTVVNVLGNLTFGPSDAIYLPPKYNNEVLLVAQSAAGTAVLKSDDGWMTAEYKGMVPMPQVDPGAALVAPVEIGEGIYQVFAYFGDVGLNGQGTAGNRSSYPFYDISAQVDELVKACEKRENQRREVGTQEQPAIANWYTGNRGASIKRREEEPVKIANWYTGNRGASIKRREEEPVKIANWYTGNRGF